jgi:16S rRNA C1402 N4-methylase RsmH
MRAAPPPPARVALLTPKPVVADEAEARRNPRARSAKLRVVEKL